MWFMALPITGFAIVGKSIEELFIRLLTLIQGHKLQLGPFFCGKAFGPSNGSSDAR